MQGTNNFESQEVQKSAQSLHIDGPNQKLNHNSKSLPNMFTDLYIQIQRYNLKANLLSINLNKKQYEFYSAFYEEKTRKKYSEITNKIDFLIKDILLQLKVAEGNQIRIFNNVLRNYRKRVDIVENVPIKEFTDRKYEQDQKWVIQQLILNSLDTLYNEKTAQKIVRISEAIKSKTRKGLSTLNQKTILQNTKITESPQQIIQVINSCEIHLVREYTEFYKCFQTVSETYQKGFQQLTNYFDKLERIASIKAYEIKTKRQLQIEEIIQKQQNPNVRNKFGRKTQSDDQEENFQFQRRSGYASYQSHLNFTNPYSLANDFIQTKNSQFYHRENSERKIHRNQRNEGQNKFSQSKKKVGIMFNKKKGKAGIVQKQKKFIKIIDDWHYDVDQQQKRVSFRNHSSFNDHWRRFYQNQKSNLSKHSINGRKGIQKDSKGSIPINYGFQYNLAKEQVSIESIITRVYPSAEDFQFLYNYDRYGYSKHFCLISPFSNFLQRRIQFEGTYQVQLQQSFAQLKEQLESKRRLAEEYIETQKRQAQISKGGLENKLKDLKNNRLQDVQAIQKTKAKQQIDLYQLLKSQILDKDQKFVQKDGVKVQQKQHISYKLPKQALTKEKIPQQFLQKAIKKSSNAVQNSNNQHAPKIQCQQFKIVAKGSYEQNVLTDNSAYKLDDCKSLLSFLIGSYFKNVQIKYSRIAKDQKTIKTFYFQSLESVNWEYLSRFSNQTQRIFLILQFPNILLVRIQNFYSLQRQRAKCTVSQYDNGLEQTWRDFLKRKVKSTMYEHNLVSFKFQDIDVKSQVQDNPKGEGKSIQKLRKSNLQLPCENINAVKCLLGMLFVLIYEQRLEEAQYNLDDYIEKGNQLIEEYQSYLNEADKQNQSNDYSASDMIKFKSKFNNCSKINYLFDLEGTSGIQFEKMTQIINNQDDQQPLEVFKALKFKQNGSQQKENDQENSQQKEEDDVGNLFGRQENNLQSETIRKKQEQESIKEKQQSLINNEEINRIEEICYDENKNFMTQKAIKRSNSRQQLNSIKQSNLINFQKEQMNIPSTQSVQKFQQETLIDEEYTPGDQEDDQEQQYMGFQ